MGPVQTKFLGMQKPDCVFIWKKHGTRAKDYDWVQQRNLHFDCEVEQKQNSCHALRMDWHSLFLVAHAQDVSPWMGSRCPIAFNCLFGSHGCQATRIKWKAICCFRNLRVMPHMLIWIIFLHDANMSFAIPQLSALRFRINLVLILLAIKPIRPA